MGAFCQKDWTQADEDNLAIETLAKVLHPALGDGWKPQISDYMFLCRHCRCQIASGSRYYWHSTGWLAYHPQCVQGALEKRGG